jgi:hypothetical protein
VRGKAGLLDSKPEPESELLDFGDFDPKQFVQQRLADAAEIVRLNGVIADLRMEVRRANDLQERLVEWLMRQPLRTPQVAPIYSEAMLDRRTNTHEVRIRIPEFHVGAGRLASAYQRRFDTIPTSTNINLMQAEVAEAAEGMLGEFKKHVEVALLTAAGLGDK